MWYDLVFIRLIKIVFDFIFSYFEEIGGENFVFHLFPTFRLLFLLLTINHIEDSGKGCLKLLII